MTLVISPYPHDALEGFEGDLSFGFERYRTDLWGTDAVRATGAVFIPQLATTDVYLGFDDLDALEAEARAVLDNADSIAHEVFDPADPGPGAVVVDGRLLDAYAGRAPVGSVHRYIGNLMRCIAAAREAGCGLAIW